MRQADKKNGGIMKSERYAYAIEYAYGATRINRGNQANILVRFRFRGDRDRWVTHSNPDISASGYRAAVGASHPYVRRSRGEPWEDDTLALGD